MDDIVAKVVELVKGEPQTSTVEVVKSDSATADDRASPLQCTVPWVDASCGTVDLTVDGQVVNVTTAGPNATQMQIATSTAPYQVYCCGEGLVPAFDTHSSRSLASECLVEKLEALCKPGQERAIVALALMDEGAANWSEQLTAQLTKMGARYVPPRYRAAWVFLWTPTQSFEAYRNQSKGVAIVKANVNGRDFVLESAGFRDGNFAQIRVDGVKQLLSPRRGLNCCIWGANGEALLDQRRFQDEYGLVYHLSQVPAGRQCVLVCTGVKGDCSKGFQRSFYDEVIRLGGSGQTFGLSDCFVLAGTMSASPTVKRGRPSPEDISFALHSISADESMSVTFASLLFGNKPAMCLGALVLAKTLQKHSPGIPRILLISPDVPSHFQQLLQSNGWQLKPVSYIRGAYTHFKEGAKFPPEIFMKLHAFNPDALPYHKVLFLDLDTMVRKDLTAVFNFKTPAAVNNWKRRDKTICGGKEGELMGTDKMSINAGVLLTSPSKALFGLLKEDAERPGTHHSMQWCPEQSYISMILAGHVRHLHCKYNFECQIHGGTWCSEDWQKCEVDDVHIVHFSGQSPWELSSHDEVTCVDRRGFEPDRKKYRLLQSDYCRKLASQRSRLFHQEWFNLFSEFPFLQDESLDGSRDEGFEGVIPLTRMTAYLQRLAENPS